MVRLVQRIWNGLRYRTHRDWDHTCAHGTPVREEEVCHGFDCPTWRLSELRTGAQGTVSCIELPESPRAQRLVGMGILPGAAVEVLQTYPAFVIRVGQAEFAVDGFLARHIRLRVEEPASLTVR